MTVEPVELTQAEVEVLKSLARNMGQPVPGTVELLEVEGLDEGRMREIAREEIASLAGLMMRRLQDEGPTRSIERNLAVELLQGLWGETLSDFGGHTKPGDSPGEGGGAA